MFIVFLFVLIKYVTKATVCHCRRGKKAGAWSSCHITSTVRKEKEVDVAASSPVQSGSPHLG